MFPLQIIWLIMPVCGTQMSDETGVLALNKWNMDYVDLIVFLLQSAISLTSL